MSAPAEGKGPKGASPRDCARPTCDMAPAHAHNKEAVA